MDERQRRNAKSPGRQDAKASEPWRPDGRLVDESRPPPAATEPPDRERVEPSALPATCESLAPDGHQFCKPLAPYAHEQAPTLFTRHGIGKLFRSSDCLSLHCHRVRFGEAIRPPCRNSGILFWIVVTKQSDNNKDCCYQRERHKG